MKVLPCFFLLLSVTTLAGAQTVPLQTDASANRPLNLSVRKPLAPVTDETVILIDPKAQADTEASLPYGSGFESRLRGSTSAGSTSGAGGGSGSGGSSGAGGNSGSAGGSGNGGGGRGGSSRGR